MSEPKSINQALTPLILATSILGMGNFKYRVNRARRAISLLYSVCCIVAFCFLAKTSIVYLDLFFLLKATTVGVLTFKTLFYSNIFLTVCLIVIGWIKAKSMPMIIARVSKCDQTMENMGMPKNYRGLFLHQLYCFGFLAIGITIFVTVNYNWLFSRGTPLGVRVILTFTLHLPVILICVSDVSFYFWVRYTKQKFQQLNNLLRGMLTTTPDSPQHKRVLAMKFDLINKTDFPLRDEPPRGSNDNADTMKAVKQIHLELVKSARNTNDMYGIQILFTMTASFVLITGLLYDAYTIIRHDLTMYEFVREIVPVACWILFYALKIFIMNHACAVTSSEASDTGDIICELYEPSTSKEFRAEIRDFTLQLIQNPLTFTACGFFNLDHTFIQGVIGSITTYLVILIQVGDIKKAEEASDTMTSIMPFVEYSNKTY